MTTDLEALRVKLTQKIESILDDEVACADSMHHDTNNGAAVEKLLTLFEDESYGLVQAIENDDSPQHTESGAGGGAEGAGQSANTKSPAPLSAASEAAVRSVMWKLHHEADWLPEDVELLIRTAISAAVREERELCAAACDEHRRGFTADKWVARAADMCADAIRARGER